MESRIFRKSAVAAVGFFGTLGILSVGYSAYSGLSAVSPETPLTVALWTQVKDNFDDLNSRMSNFSFSGGNVGIGTANPTNKLDVNGYVGGTRLIAGQNVVIAQNSIALGDGTNVAAGGQVRSIEDGSTPWLRFMNYAANVEWMRLRNGNLGIGTTAPEAKLHVNGPMIRTVAYQSANGPNDDTDVGQIMSRVLSFTKLSASTKIRISYTDALRTYGASKMCRWEIRIDWASCPAQPLVYDYYTSNDNIHQSRTVVGYCGGINAWTKQIQIWVSNSPWYSGSDCYTWYNQSTWVIEAEEVN